MVRPLRAVVNAKQKAGIAPGLLLFLSLRAQAGIQYSREAEVDYDRRGVLASSAS